MRTNLNLLKTCPRFVVLGVQKCGTTALYAYLCDHPKVVSAVRKETHFFDWRWDEMCHGELRDEHLKTITTPVTPPSERSKRSLRNMASASKAKMGALRPGELFRSSSSSTTDRTCRTSGAAVDAMLLAREDRGRRDVAEASSSSKTSAPSPVDDGNDETTMRDMRVKYLIMYPVRAILRARALNDERAVIVSGEATPSYLLYGETVARRLRALAPDARLIVAVRNPIDRAYSHYQMTRDPVGSEFVKRIRGTYVLGNRTFEEAIEDDRRALVRCGLTSPGGGGSEKTTGAYSDAQLTSLQREYFGKLPLDHGAHSYLGRGLYAVQLALWQRHFPRRQIRVVCIDDMRDPDGCRREMTRLYEYLGLSPHVLSDEATRPRNTKATRNRTYGPMRPAVRATLARFFAPHNAALAAACGGKRAFAWD